MESSHLNGRTLPIAAKLRILVVDDHVLQCEALATLFHPIENLQVVATSTNAAEAEMLASQLRPDIILLDAELPNREAFAYSRQVMQSIPRPRLAFLDDSLNLARIDEALQIGAVGYFLRHSPFRTIASGIIRIGHGEFAFCPRIEFHLKPTPSGFAVEKPADEPSVSSLTTREREVFLHLAEGSSVKECAKHLHLAQSTVDNHKARLMKKLNVHKAMELTRIAIREGMIRV